jgi:hypothetical protein
MVSMSGRNRSVQNLSGIPCIYRSLGASGCAKRQSSIDASVPLDCGHSSCMGRRAKLLEGIPPVQPGVSSGYVSYHAAVPDCWSAPTRSFLDPHVRKLLQYQRYGNPGGCKTSVSPSVCTTELRKIK